MKVTLKDGSSKEYSQAMSIIDIAKDISEGLARVACVAELDGEVVDLRTIVDGEHTLNILTFDSDEGKAAFRHTASHVLAQAIKRLYPDAKCAIGPSIEEGFYYDFDIAPLDREALDKIEKEMKKIVKEGATLERFTLPRQEAIDLMRKREEPYKVELIEDLPEDAEISFYQQGEYIDLCAGPHLMNTKPLKAMKLISSSGAYWRGNEKNKMLTRVYGTAYTKKADLDAYLEHLEEYDLVFKTPGIVLPQPVSSYRCQIVSQTEVFFRRFRDQIVGITGTKGKTTTTYMIKNVLEAAGKKVGLIGTIGAMIGDEKIPSKNTTPESYELHRMFASMVEAGCEYAVMEVSSQGLKMDRTAGIMFDYGVFTNLSPDHIGPNEHASFEEYLECKSMLFRQCKIGILNADDEHSEAVAANHTCEIHSFGVEDNNEKTFLGKPLDLVAADLGFIKENGKLGMHFHVKGCMDCEARVHIPGRFSVYNSLVTMLVCHLAGISDQAILDGLNKVQVKGRVEMLPVSKDYYLIIDYAHNEVSTRSVLTTLMEYHPKRLICVYGGGGNRSKLRRYDMGEVTGEMADLCVLTCDNPRDEEIRDINNDIKVGLAKSNGKYIEIDDRKEAIAYCMVNAQPGDMIVLLGKGHEDYQEIRGVKYHFDEREAVAEILEEIKEGKRVRTV